MLDKPDIIDPINELEKPLELDEMKTTFQRIRWMFHAWRNPVKSTKSARDALLGFLHEPGTIDLLTGKNRDQQSQEGLLRNLESIHGTVSAEFHKNLENAKEMRNVYGIKTPAKTIRDLRNTYQKLLQTENVITKFRTALGKDYKPIPTITRPIKPSFTSAPTQISFENEKTEMRTEAQAKEYIKKKEEIERLEEDLQKFEKKHNEEHKTFDPEIEKLKELFKQMAQAQGLNTFQSPSESPYLPQHQKKFSPSMDGKKSRKETKEKPAEVLYAIEPPLGGLFRSRVCDSFNNQTLEWEERNQESEYPPTHEVQPEHHIVSKKPIYGKISLLLPKGYVVKPDTLKAQYPITFTYDKARGITYMESDHPQNFEIYCGKLPKHFNNEPPKPYHYEDIIIGLMSEATETFLQNVQSLPYEERAIAITEYVQNMIDYSTDETYNYIYKRNPKEKYFQRIEQHKKADCDVESGFESALERRVQMAARLVTGHRIDGSKNGKSEITSSTGHAWHEIWNGTDWKEIDGTSEGEEDGDGEPLDPISKQEKTDLETHPKPKKHPHDKLNQQKKELNEAKKKGLSKDEEKNLQDKQNQAKSECDNEITDNVAENKGLLDEEAQNLADKGKHAESREIWQKAKSLQKAREALLKNRNDTLKKDGVKEALKQANEYVQNKQFAELVALQAHLILQTLRELKKEAEENDERDII